MMKLIVSEFIFILLMNEYLSAGFSCAMIFPLVIFTGSYTEFLVKSLY